MTHKIYALMALALLLAPICLNAQDSLSFCKLDEINKLAPYPYLAVNGSLSVVTGRKGLIVTDHSDPSHPVSRCVLKDFENDRFWLSSQHFTFAGDVLWAYHARNERSLWGYRINGPDDVEPVGEYRSDDVFFRSIEAQGGLLCAIVNSNRFATFDVSDPQNPRQLAIIDSIDGSALAIDNGYAYIFKGDSTSIIDVRDPEAPALVSRLFGQCFDLKIHDNHAFILANRENDPRQIDTLSVYDVTNPAEPAFIASGQVQGIEMAVGDHQIALVKPGRNSLWLYSYNDDFEIQLEAETRLDSRTPERCQFLDGNILVANGYSGTLEVFDPELEELAVVGFLGVRSGVFYHRGQLIAPTDSSLVATYILDNDHRLRRASKSELWPPILTDSKAIGDVLYRACGSLGLYDISDPSEILFLDEVEAEDEWVRWRSFDAFGQWGAAKVISHDEQLQIFGMEDPLAPEPVQLIDFQDDVWSFRVGHNALFATMDTDIWQLVSFELGGDDWLVARDSLTIDFWPFGFGYSNDRLYIPTDSGLSIIDVSDIGNMVELVCINSANNFEPVGDYLFCSIGQFDITLFDMTDPTQPLEISRYHGDENICGLIWGDEVLYVSTETGIVALRVDNWPDLVRVPSAPLPQQLTMEAFPNPFNSATIVQFNLPQRLQGELLLYDPMGRMVRQLTPPGWQEAGRHRVSLDGSALPSGSYSLVFRSGAGVVGERVVLVK